MEESTEALAREWLSLDRDMTTRKEIEQLLKEKNYSKLDNRLSSRLSFGTAGLRAKMGAGFARMNSLTILQTSQGLADYLLQESSGAAEAGVVIGFDARHNSQDFAKLSATAFLAKGIKVKWLEAIVHTPMVPFAVKLLKAAAGVMITASHNPAQDNGYKVYGSNGCQINSPADRKISDSILQNLQPLTWDVDRAFSSNQVKSVLVPVRFAYVEEVRKFLVSLRPNAQDWATFIYTPMHGVGLKYMELVLENPTETGSTSPGFQAVREQAQPDPDFPTVKYPNPEEYGALDLAKSTADEHNINLIFANDPDADRFAVAEKVDGQWIQLTGDQVGVLLAHYLATKCPPESRTQLVYMLASAVSSQMLSRIAADNQIFFEETPTGFKWLGNRALELESQEHPRTVLFAYEEALGYMIPSIVHDKDGILAAGVFLGACSEWGSPWAELQRLYQRYGFYETMNTYWRSPNVATTAEVFHKVRSMNVIPLALRTLAGRRITRLRDLTEGYDSSVRDEDHHKPKLPSSHDTQMLTFWLDGKDHDKGVRFTIRSSGTEPKIKVYLECLSDSHESSHKGAMEVLKAIKKEYFDRPDLVIEEKYRDV